MFRFLCTAILCILAVSAPSSLIAQSARGLDNPTLSFNLDTPLDYSPGLQFIDLMKMMRPWFGHQSNDSWGGMTNEELVGYGFVDDKGWVTAIPPGFAKIGTIWTWNGFQDGAGRDHAGTYVLEYEGEGTLELGASARIISARPGRINFENPTAGTFTLNILETDPNKTGDYVRNITIVSQRHVDLHAIGGTFNPDWLETIQDARGLRFMNWMRTNGSHVTSWADMPSVDGPLSTSGVAIEHMVQLANEVGADPWFTMPHQADDDYVRNFAKYVRDNLDPALTVRVEYSNEVWNFSFPQTRWLLDQSVAQWGEERYVDFHAKRATEVARIWEDVFAAEAGERLINVIGTQAVNTWLTNILLTAPAWQEHEPDRYILPATVFEELATTTYFGGTYTSDSDKRALLLAAINDPNIDAQEWLAQQLQDDDTAFSIPQIAGHLSEMSKIAKSHGLSLVAYEGGQHVHHSFAVNDLTDAEVAILNAFMTDFVRSHHMADLYEDLWDVWETHGDGPFMQFMEIGASTRWGTWGLRQRLIDDNPRLRRLTGLNETTQPWWDGAKGGSFRQQGGTQIGTYQSDTLIGTSEEDYLIGGAEADIFIPNGGRDGINGGSETDRVILAGKPSDYTLRQEGEGYELLGPNTQIYLLKIEELSFADDIVLTIANLPVDATGLVALSIDR